MLTYRTEHVPIDKLLKMAEPAINRFHYSSTLTKHIPHTPAGPLGLGHESILCIHTFYLCVLDLHCNTTQPNTIVNLPRGLTVRSS